MKSRPRLEDLIAQDETIPALIDRSGRSKTWHPLARNGKNPVPDSDLVHSLAELCRHHLARVRNLEVIAFPRLGSADLFVPSPMPVTTSDGATLGKTWAASRSRIEDVYTSDDGVLALATCLASYVATWGRRAGLTSKQIETMLRPLERWTSRTVSRILNAPRRERRRRQQLSLQLAALLKNEVPLLRPPEADRVALTIATLAGAERIPKSTDTDLFERLRKRRQRVGQRATKKR